MLNPFKKFKSLLRSDSYALYSEGMNSRMIRDVFCSIKVSQWIDINFFTKHLKLKIFLIAIITHCDHKGQILESEKISRKTVVGIGESVAKSCNNLSHSLPISYIIKTFENWFFLYNASKSIDLLLANRSGSQFRSKFRSKSNAVKENCVKFNFSLLSKATAEATEISTL